MAAEVAKMGRIAFTLRNGWTSFHQVEIFPDYNTVEKAYVRGKYFGLEVTFGGVGYCNEDLTAIIIDGECPVQGSVEKIKEVFKRVRTALDSGTYRVVLDKRNLTIQTDVPAAPT